jgi:hypothetical protein
MATRKGPWILEKDYEAFKRLMPNDPDIPNTYDEWKKLVAEQDVHLAAVGQGVVREPVDPNEFANYCRMSHTDPDSIGLTAFAIYNSIRKPLHRFD